MYFTNVFTNKFSAEYGPPPPPNDIFYIDIDMDGHEDLFMEMNESNSHTFNL